MATQTPMHGLHDEIRQISRDKRAGEPRAKGLKQLENSGNQARRALKDLSNVSKGSGLKDTSTLKGKSQQKPRSSNVKDKPIPILKEKSTLKQRSEALQNPGNLTDEEIKMCHEWAKDGVEGFHSTQDDSQKLDKDLLDKRVKKKVVAVNSALRCWPRTVFDSLMCPSKEFSVFSDEPSVLELEPEILPDISRSLPSSLDDKAKMAEDCLIVDELDEYPSLEDIPVMFELKLKDEPAIPQLEGVY